MSGRPSAATERALKLIAKGMTPYAAAKKVGIALSTIYRAQKRLVPPPDAAGMERRMRMRAKHEAALRAKGVDVAEYRYEKKYGKKKPKKDDTPTAAGSESKEIK